jgi:hypothetical protein
MTTQEGLEALGMGTAARHDRAYFLDLLGDSHNGLGRYEAARARLSRSAGSAPPPQAARSAASPPGRG